MYPRPAPCPFYHIVSSVSPWSSDSLPLPPILSERLGAVCIGSSAISPHQKVNNSSGNSCSCLTWAAVADSWFYPAKFAPFLGPEPRAWEPAARAHKPGKGIFTVGRPAPPLKSWPWTTLLSCFSCSPSPLLPLAPSHCLASLLCVYLFLHSISLVGAADSSSALLPISARDGLSSSCPTVSTSAWETGATSAQGQQLHVV